MRPELRDSAFFWVGAVAYALSLYALAMYVIGNVFYPGNERPPEWLSILWLLGALVALLAAPVTFAWGLWTGGRIHGALSWSAVFAGPVAGALYLVPWLVE